MARSNPQCPLVLSITCARVTDYRLIGMYSFFPRSLVLDDQLDDLIGELKKNKAKVRQLGDLIGELKKNKAKVWHYLAAYHAELVCVDFLRGKKRRKKLE
eukprot:1140012-Pelagomonas_calceolata.AAC.2